MARTVTLLQMRTSIRSRGSYENSADITDALLNDFINEAVTELWDLLVSEWLDYKVTRFTTAVSAQQDGIPLPADFYKLRKVEIVDTSAPSGYRRLRPHDLDSAHTFWTVVDHFYRYRLEGMSNLYLAPIPQSAETLRIFYIPCSPVLSLDGDTFDGVNGFEGLIFQKALYACQDRQDEDTSRTERKIADMEKSIKARADNRDADEPFYLNPRGPGGDEWDEWELA